MLHNSAKLKDIDLVSLRDKGLFICDENDRLLIKEFVDNAVVKEESCVLGKVVKEVVKKVDIPVTV